MVWAVLFALIELSNNKTIPSEIGIIIPQIILFIFAAVQWKRYRLAT
jgi:lipopolysaccharide export system permease protein